MIKLESQPQTLDTMNNSLNSSTTSSSTSSTSTSNLINANSLIDSATNGMNLPNDSNNNNNATDANNNYLIMKKSPSSSNDHEDSFLTDKNNNNNNNTNNNDQDGEFGLSKTNLIVNYLPQNMTQDEIKELFSSIGPVESCKLIKDKLTGQSLGYAFVNFVNSDDADKAIENFNGMKLQNKTIKVSLARPSSEQIKGANLYICGLPKTFTQSDLEKMFSEFGTIISSKILTDPNTSSESKGVGFVRFDKRYEAERAIEKLNDKTYENITEPLVVKFANSPTSVKTMMGIPLAPFIPTVRGFYQPYRSTTNASYRYSPMSGSVSSAVSTGYCPTDAARDLIHHQTTANAHHHAAAAAAAVATSLNGLTAITNPAAAHLAGAANSLPATPTLATAASTAPGTLTTLVSSTSPPNTLITTPPHSLSANNLSSINYSGWPIFVYNLGPESDESLLWQLFGPFGAVQSVKVIRDMQTHKCKGFGFVTMTNYEEAITAINCLNGLNLQNRILQVSFKTNNKHIY